MKPRKTTLNTEVGESEFVRLLRKIQTHRASSELLFEHPLFQSRLRLITMAHARTEQDAEELASEVCLKVWRNLQQFKPDYRRPYGGFFSWVRAVTRHTFFDTSRRHKVEYDPQRVEDLDIPDLQMDLEASVLYKEVIAEFEKSISGLPVRQQLAIAYYLRGFTFRETADKMRQVGFPSSHKAVATWIKGGVNAFLSGSDKIRNIMSKNVRVTNVRAARAKREFYTILEQAINSGPATMNIYGALDRPVERRKTSKTTQLTSSSAGRRSANDLLKNMQSPESKQGIQAAFDASPEALGEAAVEHASKRRKVPVASLTTFLMAASTANVVERVMNLSEDAA